jgi:RHS repeat-associated protein
MMTDSSGNVIGQQAHYPYGEQWYAQSTTTKWFFTDYERDSESGNDYASFRYGVNRLGRFASPDLLAGSIGDPQSLNRYAYVRDDPVNGVDPLGLTDCNPADEVEGYCTPGGESSGVGDPYFASFGAPCLGDATACGQAGFFGYAGYGDTFGDGIPRNTAMCNVDPFCIEAGGFDMWNSPVAQSNCVYDNQGIQHCMGGSYVNATYVTGGAYKVDWYGELQDEIHQGVNAGISQQWAVAHQIQKLLQANGNNSFTADQIFNELTAVSFAGGNFDFQISYANDPVGQSLITALQGIVPNACTDSRCGSMPSLDFSHPSPFGGPADSYVHLDTANVWWGFGLGAIIHGGVDVLAGYTVLGAGIPR